MEKIMDDEQFLNLVDGIMNAIQINYNEHQTYFSHKKYFFPSISDTKYREVASIYSIWKVLNHDVLSMSLNCNYRLKANINKKISKLYEEFEEIFYNFLFDNKEKALLGYGKVLGNANKKYKTIHDDFINIIKNYLSNTFNENHIDLIMGNLTSLLKYSGSYSLKQQKGILNQFLKEIDYNCDDLSNVKQMIENKLFSLIDDEIKHFEKTFYDELKKRRFKIDLSKNSKICNQIVGKYWIYKLLCDDKNINELYSLMEKDNVKNYKKLIEILSNHVANATEYIFYDYLNILKNSYIYENNVFFACLGEKVSDFFQISFKYLEYNRKIFIYFLDSMLFDVYDTLTSNGIEVRNSIAEIVQKNIDSNDDRTFFHIKSDESRRNHDNNQLIYIRQLKLITNSNNHVTNNHHIEDISILVDRVDEFGNLLRPLNYNVHYCLECKEFFCFSRFF